MTTQPVIKSAVDKMKKSIDVIKDEFARLRTGKASPALVENIIVEYYGVHSHIREIAGITAADARTLVIQPWDMNAMESIQKAILKSELGITPQTDGKIIRLIVPELTEERRRDIDKVIKKTAEEGRVSVRNIRRDAIEEIKKEEKAKKITEDEKFRLEKVMQEETDKAIKEIDTLLAHKEKEIMKV